MNFTKAITHSPLNINDKMDVRGEEGVESVGCYKPCSRRTGTDCAFIRHLEIKLNP